jgi:hypothetical protein
MSASVIVAHRIRRNIEDASVFMTVSPSKLPTTGGELFPGGRG